MSNHFKGLSVVTKRPLRLSVSQSVSLACMICDPRQTMHGVSPSLIGFFVLISSLIYLCTQPSSVLHSSGLSRDHSQLPEGWSWGQYHSHEDVLHFLAWASETYSHITTTTSIGQSVEGRDLLTIKLSSSHNRAAQPKVKVKLVGGIHGNEQACPELLLRLMHHLISGYGTSKRITQLLDSTDIYILPVMNPDGRAADTRHNAAGKDLNRNFPLDPLPFDAPGAPSDSDSETVQAWRKTGSGPPQPEVSAVMAWSKAHNFQLSASLHQGALVANYPFDSCDTQAVVRYCPTLDDPLPLFLARSYASNHPIMRDNTNGTTKFVQGTVQGAQWYTLLGGMQDWMYWDRGSLELTLELNPVMKPPAAEVAGPMWQHNLPPLMRFIELAHMGLHGQLVDADTHKPLLGHVEVLAPSEHRPVNVTDPGGYFTLMLAPDTVYCLSIHPVDPHNSRQGYKAIKVAVLRKGGATLIKGKGIKGLAQHAVFKAVKRGASGTAAMQDLKEVDKNQNTLGQADNSLPGAAAQRHVVARRLAQHNKQHNAPLEVLAVGDAAPGMCWFS